MQPHVAWLIRCEVVPPLPALGLQFYTVGPVEKDVTQTLYIAERDADIREMLTLVLSFEGWIVRSFETAQQAFDSSKDKMPSCFVIATNSMAAVQDMRLCLISSTAPVLIAVESADVSGAIKALKWGAVDVLQKPYDLEQLTDQIFKISITPVVEAEASDTETLIESAALLTARERDVMNQITAGASNKEAGRALAISPRTVEVHRARVMEKLNAKNIADLVRIVLQANVHQAKVPNASAKQAATFRRDEKDKGMPYSAAF